MTPITGSLLKMLLIQMKKSILPFTEITVYILISILICSFRIGVSNSFRMLHTLGLPVKLARNTEKREHEQSGVNEGKEKHGRIAPGSPPQVQG
jgi:hypothetical protein